MKKLLAIILVIAMFASLGITTAFAEEEPIHLTLWTFQELHTQLYKEMLDKWNANPDNPKLDIDMQVYPYEDMHNKLTIALQSGEGAPDIVDIEINMFANYLKGDIQLADLNDIVEPMQDHLLMVPFYFMFLSSLKPGTEMLRNGLSLTFDPGISSFKNYEALNTYRDGIYWQWYKSSLIIMVLQTVVGLVLSSMVGYGLAMYRFKGRNAVFTLVLILMMVPFEILLLPLYRMLIKFHLTDTYFGVILPYLVPPFMIFFRQYVLSLPKELMEAARIDGCTDYGIFFRIMVPNMIPAFGAMTILSCMNSWNNLLWPLIVLNSNEKFTIPIGMGTTITPYGNAFDVLMPGAVMAVVPIIIVYLFAQKTFIAGLTSGSVKG